MSKLLIKSGINVNGDVSVVEGNVVIDGGDVTFRRGDVTITGGELYTNSIKNRDNQHTLTITGVKILETDQVIPTVNFWSETESFTVNLRPTLSQWEGSGFFEIEEDVRLSYVEFYDLQGFYMDEIRVTGIEGNKVYYTYLSYEDPGTSSIEFKAVVYYSTDLIKTVARLCEKTNLEPPRCFKI